MQRSAVLTPLEEEAVHPSAFTKEQGRALATSQMQVRRASSEFLAIDCPACGAGESGAAFSCSGFAYRQCCVCDTLFVSPRPPAALLDWYRKSSPIALFRHSSNYSAAVDTHRRDDAVVWADRLALDMRRHRLSGPIVELSLRPNPHLSECLSVLGMPVPCVVDPTMCDGGALLDANAAMVLAFNTIESLGNPYAILKLAAQRLSPSGRLVFSMRSASGLDILVLWENAKLLPIDHLNLFTVEGMKRFVERLGLVLSDLSTPGQLDVQMIRRAWERGDAHSFPRFIEYFLRHGDSFADVQLQTFLQSSLMSSYLVAVAYRAEEASLSIESEQR